MSNTPNSPESTAPNAAKPNLLGRVGAWLKGDSNGEAPVSNSSLRTWRRDLESCAKEQGGPVASRARALGLIGQYRAMDAATRLEALRAFATELKPDAQPLEKAYGEYAASLDSAQEWEMETRLREAMVSPRARVIRQVGSAEAGVRFLVDVRAEVLEKLKAMPELKVLDAELAEQLSVWFEVGFLELRRLSWDTPASILEKLMAYEAVHEIHSWADLKNRLDHDRRIYAYFHPRLPGEPLVFVEVALTNDIAGNVQALLDVSAPVFDTKRARAAMFYSISSTQVGLRGISFGNFLIKRVVEDLKRDFPKLAHFSTLSPVPGFAGWLKGATLPPELQQALAVVNSSPDWARDAESTHRLRGALTALVAHYLANVKERSGRPRDPVARFHLGNGARLERINWLADTSVKGLKQAYGLMVNYYYALDDIEVNVEAFDRDGTVAANSRVRRLAELGTRVLEGKPVPALADG
ncbi:MAG: malonyl-CoA decarboxylase [Betaproteobacteria bacterium]|nr:malonyl-CoA decarboxylase [Betaproteobacteria bacterium]